MTRQSTNVQCLALLDTGSYPSVAPLVEAFERRQRGEDQRVLTPVGIDVSYLFPNRKVVDIRNFRRE